MTSGLAGNELDAGFALRCSVFLYRVLIQGSSLNTAYMDWHEINARTWQFSVVEKNLPKFRKSLTSCAGTLRNSALLMQQHTYTCG